MDLGLSQKRVLITGGSGTIGRATARLFLDEGADVAIAGRDDQRLREAASLLGEACPREVLTVKADLRIPAEVQRMIDSIASAWAGLDVLVNLAGTNVRGSLDDLDAQLLWSALELKLLGYMNCIHAALPLLRHAGGGRIVNVVGQAGKRPQASALPAAATNAAVLAASKALADALATENIAVNVVCPMGVESPLVTEIAREAAASRGLTEEAVRGELIERLPIGRLASPAEIADVIVFVASGRASFVNGTTLDVDGGYQRYIV
jgi:NAD(P)-dependent dehydrogenase (short-subunit alcohol dehydrogenase family)